MSSRVAKTASGNDWIGAALTLALVTCLAVYTTSYEHAPALRSTLASIIALLSLGLAYIAALGNFMKALPLLIALLVITAITVALQWAQLPQDFNVLLRYLTAVAGIFAMHMVRLPDLTRYIAFVSMFVIAYAGFISATGGPFLYAGTVRTFPFWAGLANSSFLVAALIIVIALASIRRAFKIPLVVSGLVILAGYGAVTAMLMVAVFFAGWYFLYRGWKRIWLLTFGALTTIGGVLFRNANSAAGADIDSLGVGAVGSGRLDSWYGRLVEFADRDFATMLLGQGPYSDYQISDLWYWAEKNAHSDLITILMEFGLFGFAAILWLGLATYRRASGLAQVALLAITVGAVASNTFIDRPAVAVSWGLVLYACAFHRERQQIQPMTTVHTLDLQRSFQPSIIAEREMRPAVSRSKTIEQIRS